MKRGVTLPRPMSVAISPRSGCLRRLRRRPASWLAVRCSSTAALAAALPTRRAALYSLHL
jgi:hypothetical protein